MADNSKVISIFHDMVKYWRERAKDYIENGMEEDDSSDDIEDPIYAKLRFCDIIDNYLNVRVHRFQPHLSPTKIATNQFK